MPIVLIGESLLIRSTATDGRILGDSVLSCFGMRLGLLLADGHQRNSTSD